MQEQKLVAKRIVPKAAVVGKPVVPWMPDSELRDALIAMKHLERKFERLHKQGARQAMAELDRQRLKAEVDAKKDVTIVVNINSPLFSELKKAGMLDRSKTSDKARLMKKAAKLQQKIDKLSSRSTLKFNERMFKEAA